MLYAVIGLIFIAVLLGANALLLVFFGKERSIEKIKYYDTEQRRVYEEIEEEARKGKNSLLKTIARGVPQFFLGEGNRNKTALMLIRAGSLLKPEELFVIKSFSSIFGVFTLFFLSKNIFVAIIIAIAVWNIPRIIIYQKTNKRIKEFDEQISEGITIISNSLKAGYSFLQASSVVAEETEGPFAIEFKKLLKEMSLGIPMGDALINMLNRVPSDDFRLIVNAILIQKDVGGNLSEILDNIASTISERQKIKNEIKTLTAQGKLSGMIVVLMPVFLGAFMYVINKDYIMLLFSTKLGIGMLVSAITSQMIGIWLINKIVKIEV